jgi:hypothetical protein
MFVSHLCCDFNQRSPDVATRALLAQEASTSWLSPEAPVGSAELLAGGVGDDLCCPAAQLL